LSLATTGQAVHVARDAGANPPANRTEKVTKSRDCTAAAHFFGERWMLKFRSTEFCGVGQRG
jgi:hypothetical protein